MNKNMLITGGALRIGEAIALFFAQKKWNIGIHYNTSKKEALKLQKKILSFGVKCCIVKSDLSDDKNVAKLF
jgi:NAD(P)-dependent dehydrogenase (short-subunit alcohol dehydrogenase family)